MRKLEVEARSDLVRTFSALLRLRRKLLRCLLYKLIKYIGNLSLKEFRAAYHPQYSKEEANHNPRFCFIIVGGVLVVAIIVFIRRLSVHRET